MERKQSPEVNIRMEVFVNVDRQNASLLQVNLVLRNDLGYPDYEKQ